MSRHDSAVSLRHMLDHAMEAVEIKAHHEFPFTNYTLNLPIMLEVVTPPYAP